MPDAIPTFYRLDIYTPLGVFKDSLGLDEQGLTKVLNLVGGPGLEIAPLGICREATFTGDPSTLGIGPRDWVDVMYSTDGTTWTARYSGVAVQNGNTDSLDPGTYKLMGGLLRLNEVETRSALAQGDVGAQVRQAIDDARGSRQLGNAIQIPSTERIPDVGGTPNGRVLPRFRNVGPLVTGTLVGKREGLVFGVNAAREVVFGTPTGTLLLDEAEGVVFEDTSTNAEVLCTHVRVFWSSVVGGTVLLRTGPVQRDGKNVQVLMDSEAGIATLPLALDDGSTFGQAWEKLPLVVDSQFFDRVLHVGDIDVVPGITLSAGSGTADLTADGDDAALADADRNTYVSLRNTGSGTVTNLRLTVQYARGSPDQAPLGLEWVADNATLRSLTIDSEAGAVTVQNPTGKGGFLLFSTEAQEFLASLWATVPCSITYSVDFQDASKLMLIRAACPLLPRMDGLLAEVRTMLRLPAVNPTKATVFDTQTRSAWALDAQAGMAELVRRWPDGTERSRSVRPISLYRFQVSEEGDYSVEVAIGEADQPEDSARAAIIARRAREATVSAVMAT